MKTVAHEALRTATLGAETLVLCASPVRQPAAYSALPAAHYDIAIGRKVGDAVRLLAAVEVCVYPGGRGAYLTGRAQGAPLPAPVETIVREVFGLRRPQ